MTTSDLILFIIGAVAIFTLFEVSELIRDKRRENKSSHAHPATWDDWENN